MGVYVNMRTMCLVPGEAMVEFKVCAGGLYFSVCVFIKHNSS